MHLPLTCIIVQGRDAEKFLQGQCTNDVSALTNTNWQWSAICNPKGRIIASFVLFKLAKTDNFALIARSDIAPYLANHLQKFIFRDQVSISTTMSRITTTEPLSTLNSSAQYLHVSHESTFILEELGLTKDPEKRFTLAVKLAPSSSEEQTEIIHPELLDRLMVEHCLLWIGGQLSEKLVPNNIEFDLLGGVSYSKGCYTGQEIIARLHYLGKKKEALYRATINEYENVHVGDDIFAPSLFGEQPIGTVLALHQQDSKAESILTMKVNCEHVELTLEPAEGKAQLSAIARVIPEKQTNNQS